MSVQKTIPVVDLFAGPGGLGEGFSAREKFRILVSAEMDEHAHSTLRLRAFYRIAKRHADPAILQAYYRFCNENVALPKSGPVHWAWEEASNEAQRMTLGVADDNRRLDKIITKSKLGGDSPWVLIGGPPCQAYSLVGRARNRGKSDYVPEKDKRHFLYREYLRIIQKYRPAVFVMENVKGILSSSIKGEKIFQTILKDLSDPDLALEGKSSKIGYKIFSLSHPIFYERSQSSVVDPHKFIVRAEDYGVPQARHRVILLGIREDIDPDCASLVLPQVQRQMHVDDALEGLPPRRSKISKQKDNSTSWFEEVQSHFKLLRNAAADAGAKDLAAAFKTNLNSLVPDFSTGALRTAKVCGVPLTNPLSGWYDDPALKVWLNHEARGHMSSDLLRYAYASVFAQVKKRSPKGHQEFDLTDALRPSHANWETGKFADRFRVQRYGAPSTTVTSHISKDGHYFIHPDPKQCRSLTVREAARLQTFPDNYFFQGNRTQQFHQVGNAVPPLLATKIAQIVESVLSDSHIIGVNSRALIVD